MDITLATNIMLLCCCCGPWDVAAPAVQYANLLASNGSKNPVMILKGDPNVCNVLYENYA